MKKLLLVALAAITLASCAQHEVVEVNKGNEISFRTWTANAGRTAPTTTESIKNLGFTVWAYTKDSGVLYMDAVDVDWNSLTPDAWDYAPHKFWPAEALHFYSVAPKSVKGLVNYTAAEVAVENFVVEADAANQIDLLYAVNTNEARRKEAVQVKFDHALSQVSFKASNSNTAAQGIEVVITGVKVAGVNSTGNFTLPITANTDATNKAATALQTAWEVSVPAAFTAGMAAATYTVTDTAKELTNEAGRLLLLPQTTAAWTPAADYAVAKGACFLVNCTIKDLTSNIYLWAEDASAGGAKELAIPVAVNWDPGKHYVYTFIFGEGAGYDPTTGQEVLDLITFEVAVDDFAAGVDAGVDALGVPAL